MSRARTMSRGHGFTLIEILCVLVIIGIASGIIIPQMSSRNDLKAAAAARVMMADLVYAQNRAITLQQTTLVTFDINARKYGVYKSDLAALTHPVNKTSYVQQFGLGGTTGLTECTLVSANITGLSNAVRSTLAFDDLGAPLAYNTADGTSENIRSGAVVVQCGAHQLQLTIEPYTGQITVAPVP